MCHGDVTHGGVQRDFLEAIDGVLQGCVFRWTQGLEAGVNRLALAPDGRALRRRHRHDGQLGAGGQAALRAAAPALHGCTAFEMLDVRAEPRGLRVTFTEPLAELHGLDPDGWLVESWRYTPTDSYGGVKVDELELGVSGVSVDDERRELFLNVAGLKPGHVIYVRALDPLRSPHGASCGRARPG